MKIEFVRAINLANVCQVVSDKNFRGQISKKGKLNKPTGCGFEENRGAMACQGCGAVFLFLNKEAVETKS